MCNIGSGLAGEVALTGQPTEGVDKGNIITYSPVMHPSAVLCRDEQDDCEDRAADVLAVIELCRLVDDPPHNCEYLSLALQTAGISITNMIISCEEEIRRRTAEALLSITQIAPLGMDLLDLVGKITDDALHMINAEYVYIFFVDDYSKEIWSATSSSSESSDVRIPVGKSISGLSALTGQIMNIPDCRLDPLFDSTLEQQQGEQVTSMLCVPIPPPPADNFVEDGMNIPHHRLSAWSTGKCYLPKSRLPSQDTSSATNNKLKSRTIGTSPKHTSIRSSKSNLLELLSARPPAQRLRSNSLSQTDFSGSDSVRYHTAPTAILKAVNKRGGESFDGVDEYALALFCAEVNNILVPRAVEANLMRRAVSERRSSMSGGFLNVGGRPREDTLQTIETSILREYGPVGFHTMRTKALDLHWVPKDPKVCKNSKFSGVMGNTMAMRTSSCSGGGVAAASQQIQSLSLSPMSKRLVSPAFTAEGIELCNWDFDPFKEDVAQKCRMIENMFQHLGFEEHLGVDSSVLRLWVQRVRELYQPNPFHNFNHAFSVAHVTWMVLHEVGTSASFSALEMIACLMASYCHDVDHPGNSNVFEVQSESDLALMYSDDAVLERHHIHMTFRVLREQGGSANILKGLDRSRYQDVREIVIKGILATDMSQHVSHCSRLRKFVSKYCCNNNDLSRWSSERDSGMKGLGRQQRYNICTSLRGSSYKPIKRFSGPPTLLGFSGIITPAVGPTSSSFKHISHSDENSGRQHQNHMFLLETVIHCADLSGQVLATHLALDWGRRVLQEFKNQAVLEESLGLPITFSQESDEVEVMKGQLFFLTNIVQPLWEPFVDIFPMLDHRIVQIQANIDYYKTAVQIVAT